MQEYDLERKPFKIIKCQWLAKMLTESNQEAIEMEEKEQISVVVNEIEDDKWYSNIIYYLNNITFPDHLVNHKRRSLRLKGMKYYLTQDGLGWRNPDGVILRCVNKEEANKLVTDFHSGYCGVDQMDGSHPNEESNIRGRDEIPSLALQ
jgi:hypothetical protein